MFWMKDYSIFWMKDCQIGAFLNKLSQECTHTKFFQLYLHVQYEENTSVHFR